MKTLKELLSEGKHTISGIGRLVIPADPDYCYSQDQEYVLLCIDGVTIGAYMDPSDGYRSYASFYIMQNHECEYKFPPQDIIIEHFQKNTVDETGWPVNYEYIKMTDPITTLTVLEVGTDYSDSYYPMAIFSWFPKNLSINSRKQ